MSEVQQNQSSILGERSEDSDRGGVFMTEKHIKLSPDTVVTFVKKSQQCDFNIDISYGHTEVDAKSLLGMLSLDFGRIMHVKYYGKNEDLEGYINELAVE